MLDVICFFALCGFGIFAGLFIGSGNRAGLIGAIICGALTGVVLNLPFLPNGDRLSNVLLFLSAIAGSVIVNFIHEDNPLKRRLHDQKGLRLNLGKYYQIGCED